MATSVVCSLGVHLVFLQFLFQIFGQSLKNSIAKKLCLWREARIKTSDTKNVEPKDIKLIAGLDISTYNNFDCTLAVASCTLCTYPDLKVRHFVGLILRIFFSGCLYKRWVVLIGIRIFAWLFKSAWTSAVGETFEQTDYKPSNWSSPNRCKWTISQKRFNFYCWFLISQ